MGERSSYNFPVKLKHDYESLQALLTNVAES